MRISGLRQVGLTVTDLDRAIDFYAQVVGIPLIARFGALAFMDLGGVRLLLEQQAVVEARAALYLSVEEIHPAHATLVARGVEFLTEPHVIFVDEAGTFGVAGHAEWMAFFTDPDGNVAALSSREPT